MRSTLEAPPRGPDPMIPGMGLLMVDRDLKAEEALEPAPSPKRRRGRARRVLGSRWVAWSFAAVVVVSVAGIAAVAISDARSDVDVRAGELTSLRTELAETTALLDASGERRTELLDRIGSLRARIAELEAARVRTVVETETVTVTETVTRYVPNGEEVTVETTGFEGMVRIYDVQLTHSYGYSDLIGIAKNTSGEAISYAQLGCSFLDEDGQLLASSIDNKQEWQPGQTWGFVCSAEVDATGGILRVDELS